MLMPRDSAIGRDSSTIWLTSSRVGARIRAEILRTFGSSTSMIGAAKAIVLPEPVGLLARTSTPSRTSSMTSAWMAKGLVMPRSASAPTTGCDRPSSAKDFCDKAWYSLAALRAVVNDSGGLSEPEPSGWRDSREHDPRGQPDAARWKYVSSDSPRTLQG